MKKLLLLALSVSLLFACSKNNGEDLGNPTDQVIELAAVNQISSGFGRGGIYSSAAVHKVAKVDIYVFQKNVSEEYTYKETFAGIAWPSVSATFLRYEIPTAQRLEEGDYKLVAVGREATDHFTITTPEPDVTKYDELVAAVTSNYLAFSQAIFAGVSDLSVNDQGGGRTSIEMTRKVSGMVGYFSNVPTEIDGKSVNHLYVLAEGNANLGVNLITGTGQNPQPPVGGRFTVVTISNLQEQTTTQVNGTDVYTGNTITSATINKLDNTQLGGFYLFPTTGMKMQIVLINQPAPTDNPIVLKTWTVKNNGLETFNIDVNNLYMLGQKSSDTDTGKPLNLFQDAETTLNINPDWTGVNNLESDPNP